jgi:hypothetical protein
MGDVDLKHFDGEPWDKVRHFAAFGRERFADWHDMLGTRDRVGIRWAVGIAASGDGHPIRWRFISRAPIRLFSDYTRHPEGIPGWWPAILPFWQFLLFLRQNP